eukprot:746144-Hanusia_phi.AAC.1
MSQLSLRGTDRGRLLLLGSTPLKLCVGQLQAFGKNLQKRKSKFLVTDAPWGGKGPDLRRGKGSEDHERPSLVPSESHDLANIIEAESDDDGDQGGGDEDENEDEQREGVESEDGRLSSLQATCPLT